MNTNGWDTISVLNIEQVNTQLKTRLGALVMTFDTSWVDGFSGSYTATGSFGPWSITGGSGSDIYLTLPITSGSLQAQGSSAAPTDISGMSVTVIVNLEWVPAVVTPQGKSLQFALSSVTASGATRQPGGIYVKSVTDPKNTGFGAEVGSGIANVLLDSKDKITFIFAQTGVVDLSTATWLAPRQSTYSFQQPGGGNDQYLAILSVVDDRDISTLSSNIDAGIASTQYPLSFVISGDLFLQYVILPSLTKAFTDANASTFAYANGQITAVHPFNLSGVKSGAITYIPKVSSMVVTVDANALKNVTSGSVYLDMPNAYLDFSATTSNVLSYDPTHASFAFQKDPHPTTSTKDRVPWYDYLLTLGALGAAITAIVLAAVESGLAGSLSGSALAGSLSAAPATSVTWQGLGQITIAAGSLNDCFLLQANVA
ncbi:TULIP family P47-like protein [Variovorax sp. dw_308]|uniref:TULIP family P47-like protein n=1 Tax=Variovorax sp. dw_308 TaxID=2721546 RepID=UPI001C4538B7|nr:TULIP family P47-like protein [Variovorax sp. dw_308]